MSRKPTKARRGATLVEAAIVIALVLLLLFGIFEYSRLLFMRQLVDHAAREGARFAVVHTADKQTDDVTAVAQEKLVGFGSDFEIRVYAADANGDEVTSKSWKDAAFGEYVVVEINGTFQPATSIIPGFGGPFAIQGRSMMYSEAN